LSYHYWLELYDRRESVICLNGPPLQYFEKQTTKYHGTGIVTAASAIYRAGRATLITGAILVKVIFVTIMSKILFNLMQTLKMDITLPF
jgi:hypothetical protein